MLSRTHINIQLFVHVYITQAMFIDHGIFILNHTYLNKISYKSAGMSFIIAVMPPETDSI